MRGRSPKPRQDWSDIQSYRCGEYGHMARECRDSTPSTQGGSDNESGVSSVTRETGSTTSSRGSGHNQRGGRHSQDNQKSRVSFRKSDTSGKKSGQLRGAGTPSPPAAAVQHPGNASPRKWSPNRYV
eukprot:GHVR01177038.1.p1 GENE.GHVR01177038.1~~GHVR01177038.1.p1  ORF type:complete len:127 (+),score=14.79 GHVR01177038.1:107-487(+)